MKFAAQKFTPKLATGKERLYPRTAARVVVVAAGGHGDDGGVDPELGREEVGKLELASLP